MRPSTAALRARTTRAAAAVAIDAVADSVMSKHLKVLQDAGYVTLTKPTGSGRVRTWASLTPVGRRAFRGHVAELQRMASMSAT